MFHADLFHSPAREFDDISRTIRHSCGGVLYCALRFTTAARNHERRSPRVVSIMRVHRRPLVWHRCSRCSCSFCVCSPVFTEKLLFNTPFGGWTMSEAPGIPQIPVVTAQRLPVQAAADWRLWRGQIVLAAAFCGHNLHGILHLHHWR